MPSPPALLALFLALAAVCAPFWLNAGREAPARPALPPAAAKPCVLPLKQIRAEHMLLLREWRDTAVRDGARLLYSGETNALRSGDGRPSVPMALKTCTDCHGGREAFCDACHLPNAVTPNCWDCHAF